jgi:hypothetical protein
MTENGSVGWYLRESWRLYSGEYSIEICIWAMSVDDARMRTCNTFRWLFKQQSRSTHDVRWHFLVWAVLYELVVASSQHQPSATSSASKDEGSTNKRVCRPGIYIEYSAEYHYRSRLRELNRGNSEGVLCPCCLY